MRQFLAHMSILTALFGSDCPLSAHHYFPMFDQEHPMQLFGTVRELRYTSAHTFIILEVKDSNGATQSWTLEGGALSSLARQGWSTKTLKTGDEVELTIDPLRDGAPGGTWNTNKINFKDGRPVIAIY